MNPIFLYLSMIVSFVKNNWQTIKTVYCDMKQIYRDLKKLLQSHLKKSHKNIRKTKYKRTLESFLTPNDRKNLEILKKRLELEPDSNNVKQELLQEVKVVEEKVVQKAEEVVAKGIKGSKRVEQARK